MENKKQIELLEFMLCHFASPDTFQIRLSGKKRNRDLKEVSFDRHGFLVPTSTTLGSNNRQCSEKVQHKFKTNSPLPQWKNQILFALWKRINKNQRKNKATTRS